MRVAKVEVAGVERKRQPLFRSCAERLRQRADMHSNPN